MNAIVLIALKRPYTFVVLGILIAIFGGLAARRTPTDIFPNIRIPVVAVVWTYTGLTPEDMSGRVIYYYERALTSTVDNIEHIESQSLYGRGIVKIFFQPGTDVAAGQAQVASISQTVPGRPIAAKFLTTARAFSPDTRTAVTELTVDNADHAIWPGSYVDVELKVPADPGLLTVPEQALIFGAAGIQVAIVDPQQQVHLRNVTLGENLGEAVQITSGLEPGDKLVNNPPAGLLEGTRVRPVKPAGSYFAASKALGPPPGVANGIGHAGAP